MSIIMQKDRNMSDINMISTLELQNAIEVIEDLVALTDPSDYLKIEAEGVIQTLKALDSITTEVYLLLNKLKES